MYYTVTLVLNEFSVRTRARLRSRFHSSKHAQHRCLALAVLLMLPLLVVSLAMPAGASRVAAGPNALPLGVRPERSAAGGAYIKL